MRNCCYLLLIALLFGCRPSYKLNGAEEKYANDLRKACNCNVKLEKDAKAESGKTNEGTVWVELNYTDSKQNICAKDSIELFHNAQNIAANFATVLGNKERYKQIAVQFFSSDFQLQGAEIPACDRTYYFDRATNQFIRYSEPNKN
ncbi:MAG: hypothetical protein ACTHJ0_04825 [Flavipsychrobacter sp.]